MKQIEAFKCDFCGKLYQRRHSIIQHEIRCSKNPDNKRACFGCKYLNKKRTFIYVDYPNGAQEEVSRNYLFCSKKNHFIYPPIVKYKGIQPDMADINEEMPRECDLMEETLEKGQVFLDGTDTLWVTSVQQGNEPGNWNYFMCD